VYAAYNFNCRISQVKDFSTSQAVMYAESGIISTTMQDRVVFFLQANNKVIYDISNSTILMVFSNQQGHSPIFSRSHTIYRVSVQPLTRFQLT